MKLICAKWGSKNAAKTLDTSRRSTSRSVIKNSDISVIRKIALLVAMLLFSGAANAQFCPQNFDGVTAPALPAGWTASALTGAVSPWVTSTASSVTTPNAAFAADPAFVSDNVLTSPATPVTAANSMFYFRHSYNTESTFDGGVLEISIDGGAYTDIIVAGGSFSAGGYSALISTSFMSPIAGRMAWTGNSGGFIVTGVTLPAATVGHNVAVRWRATSDTSVGTTGWYVDSILCGAAPPPPPTPWNLAAPYPIPILDQGVTTIGNALYSFGGVSAGAVVAASYQFDGGTWTAIAAVPTTVSGSAVASDGQYAYIVGGYDGSALTTAGYRYNPIANSYTAIAPSPTATASSAAVYLDGKIYKIAGSTDGSGTPSNVVEAYNIAGNNWSTVAAYPAAETFVSAFALGHFIYAAGGAGASAVGTLKTYRYDPATNFWSDGAIADLPQTRWGAATATFHGDGLVAGGYVNGAASANISATALQWNAQANTWTALPDMLQGRARFSGGALRGCFFATGGRSSSGAGANFAGTTENQKLDCVFYDGFEP